MIVQILLLNSPSAKFRQLFEELLHLFESEGDLFAHETSFS